MVSMMVSRRWFSSRGLRSISMTEPDVLMCFSRLASQHNLSRKHNLFYTLVPFMLYWRISNFWLHRKKKFLYKALALFCGRYKKNERTRINNTHLDCKLCILLYLNLPKMCKAPHVCHLDSQLSVRITSLSLSLSRMWEKRIILMRIWRQECWTWEQEAYILHAFFNSYLITDLLSLCLNMCVQWFKGWYLHRSAFIVIQ